MPPVHDTLRANGAYKGRIVNYLRRSQALCHAVLTGDATCVGPSSFLQQALQGSLDQRYSHERWGCPGDATRNRNQSSFSRETQTGIKCKLYIAHLSPAVFKSILPVFHQHLNNR